jgi:adenylosuccinate synthase
LHTIPSGIFNPKCINIIGNGVIIDPAILQKEIINLESSGVEVTKNLFVSRKAHLILPSHRLIDAASEFSKGLQKIGSTLKGIGPTYTDKTARNGLRVGDVSVPDFFEKYTASKNRHLQTVAQLGFDYTNHMIDGFDFETYEKRWFASLELLKKLNHIDSEYFINDLLQKGKNVLAEGAQGSLLDVDFGSYPFVTSSNTTIAGVCSGLGIAPSKIGKVYGIFKAYCTRVGSGPFPTELLDADGENMRKTGNEFGSTTGRPRRCGWLDLPALNYAIMLNGVTDLIMMKADVLDGFKTINVAVAYQYEGKRIAYLPFDATDGKLVPVYSEITGWNCKVTELKEKDGLPVDLENYIHFIENEVKTPVTIVSTGPDRTQIVYR